MNTKNFIVVKNEKKTEDIHPEYKAMFKPEDSEFWIEIAGGWVKTKEDGSKYMSFKMADFREWEYEGKKHWREGFTVTQDPRPEQATPESQTASERANDEIKYPEDEINPDDIPF